MKFTVFFLLFSCMVFGVSGQQKDTTDIFMGTIIGKDTVISRTIDEITVLPKRQFKNKRQYRRYSRLVTRVKKVYPLAVKARELLKEYEPQYYALEEKRDKRKLMKKLEKELLAEHKEELKKWSITDGRILLKLINRETERTPYSLIKDFRGDVSAVFWQGIAKLFRNNLKSGYDPDEEDRMIEEIVILIEAGYL